MRILAFDTSTHWLSVACGSGEQWQARAERAGEAHSQRLLPLVDAALADAGWTLADLDGIAFGAGPGSFTGVRIACGVAQGLALGADLPVVGIPTLAALAQAAWTAHGARRVFACLDARMREVYIAAYARNEAGWEEILAPAVLRPGDVELPAGGPWRGVGDGFSAWPELAANPALAGVDADAAPDAVAVGQLALPVLQAGEGVAAAQARPLYVRHRIALTSSERAAGLRL